MRVMTGAQTEFWCLLIHADVSFSTMRLMTWRALSISPCHSHLHALLLEKPADGHLVRPRVGTDGWRSSPRHRMPFNPRNEGSDIVSMTWRLLSISEDDGWRYSPRHRMPFD